MSYIYGLFMSVWHLWLIEVTFKTNTSDMSYLCSHVTDVPIIVWELYMDWRYISVLSNRIICSEWKQKRIFIVLEEHRRTSPWMNVWMMFVIWNMKYIIYIYSVSAVYPVTYIVVCTNTGLYFYPSLSQLLHNTLILIWPLLLKNGKIQYVYF